MADDTTSSTEDSAVDDGSVVLVSPDGVEVTAKSPVAINNLVYGKGYRLKGNEAAVKAADPDAGGHVETAEPTGTQTSVGTPSAAAKPGPKSPGKPATGTPST